VRVVRLSLVHIRDSPMGSLREAGLITVQRPSSGNGRNRRCDVNEGCGCTDATGIAEMLHAVREPYAGKLACTVLRGPRFREGTWLPSKGYSVRLKLFQQTRAQPNFKNAS
jgi:hypothetical protein